MVGVGAARRAAILKQHGVDGAQADNAGRQCFDQFNGAGFKRVGDINAPSVGAGQKTRVKVVALDEVEERVVDLNPMVTSGEVMQARRHGLPNADPDQP